MASANGLAWLAASASAVLVTAILYRSLGPATFGIWATVVSIKAFITFLEGGLSLASATFAAQTVGIGAEGEGVRSTIRVASVVAASAVLFGVAASWVPGYLLALDEAGRSTAMAVMVIAGLEAALTLFGGALAGVLKGRERFEIVASGALLQAVVVVLGVAIVSPSLGIVGAAVVSLVARIVGVLPVLAITRRLYTRLFTATVGTAALRRTVTFSAPIWLIGLGSQVSLGADVPIVGAFFGAGLAGTYAVGAMAPAAAVGLLFAIVDTALPRLARSSGGELPFVRRLTMGSLLLAGLGFTVMIGMAPEILFVWIGRSDPLATTVLQIYALVWLANVPAHILSLMAIAVADHGRLVRIVLIEAAASVGLSVFLAAVGWPYGPAVASLVTIGVSNLLVVPWVILRNSRITHRAFWGSGLAGVVLGSVLGAVVLVAVRALGTEPLGSLGIALVLTVVSALLSVLAVIREDSPVPRWVHRLRYGGIGVLLRQRREVVAAQARLAEVRSQTPVIWRASDPPLVTVRIATYNRGEVVRDRAIASALAQDYPNFEVVVVGDRCDPATEAAVRSVRDPRVRFENLPERGAYPSDPNHRWMVAGTTPMNRALDLARGEWIAPLDDDDEFTSDHISVLIDACRTRSLEFAWGRAETETEPGLWRSVGEPVLQHGDIVHAAVLFARNVAFIRHDIEAWRLSEPGDWNVWRRMRDAGVRMGFVDHVVTRHFLERRELR